MLCLLLSRNTIMTGNFLVKFFCLHYLIADENIFYSSEKNFHQAPRLQKEFMLNSAEHEILSAHKCKYMK